ncbi:MAG: hypothetical protein JXA03_14275 [Bacteroidales bacterium]|nr:hypothetical protein [Bacteroidales bacterium]
MNIRRLKPTRILSSFAGELLIVLALIFVINNYIGNVDKRISSDGEGYYDYLPAIFIYNDLPRSGEYDGANHSARITGMKCYSSTGGHKVNKYPAGTALLISPFFVCAHLSAPSLGYVRDGFSYPYRKAVFAAALFYLFSGLIFLKKLLRLYDIRHSIIFFIQLLAVFATSLIHYVNNESAFSHVYSFFAITAFFYVAKSYFQNQRASQYIKACIVLGLIFLLRPVNLLVVLALPFLAGSFPSLKNGFLSILKRPVIFMAGILCLASIMFIQLLLWRYQTSSWFVDTYPDERFFFNHPAFFSILFSYRKGLFVYTPVLLFSVTGLYFYLKKKQFFMFSSWLLFFLILTYVLSSWESWYYGCSYGLRAYIDYYPLFFIPLATGISALPIKPRLAVILLCAATIPVNAIQTYQYKEYILHWDNMDREKYWQIFLKTDLRYKGFVWREKNRIDTGKAVLLKAMKPGDLTLPPGMEKMVLLLPSDSVPGYESLYAVRMSLFNDFNRKEKSGIMMKIAPLQSDEYDFKHKAPLIHFETEGFNKLQKGEFFYILNKKKDRLKNNYISIHIETGDDTLKLRDIRIEMYGKPE